MSASRDPEGFTRLRTLCEQDASVSAGTTTQVAYRPALVLAARGGTMEQVSIGDVMDLFAAGTTARAAPRAAAPASTG